MRGVKVKVEVQVQVKVEGKDSGGSEGEEEESYRETRESRERVKRAEPLPITPEEDYMAARRKDRIPAAFGSAEEAGDFWDTHSLADYENDTKTVEVDFEITKRTRQITVPETVYRKLARRPRRTTRRPKCFL